MASGNVLHVLYNDDDILMKAVKELRSKHYRIIEVYTPFPVHGLDKAMGLPYTRIAICSLRTYRTQCGYSYDEFYND